jgi:hypothetical protein
MATLTAANSVIFLGINVLFPNAVQLQGFAADDVTTTQPIPSAETLMGVDGNQSGGFVYVSVPWTIALQADSASNAVFDTWWQQQQLNRDLYWAYGTISITSLGTKFTLNRGALVEYVPMPDLKKLIQPRRYRINWNSIVATPSNQPPAN